MLAPPIAIYKDTYLVAAALAKMDKRGAGNDDITMGLWEELRMDEGEQGTTMIDMESVVWEEGAETRSVEMSDYGSASSLPSTQSSMAGPMEGGTLGLMEDMNSVLVTCPSTIDLDAVVQDTVIADITPTPPNFTITAFPTGPDPVFESNILFLLLKSQFLDLQVYNFYTMSVYNLQFFEAKNLSTNLQELLKIIAD